MRDLHILKDSDDVSPNRFMDAGLLHPRDHFAEVGLNQRGVGFCANPNRPRGTLGDAIFPLQEQLHQSRKPTPVTADPAGDPLRLRPGMFAKDFFFEVHFSPKTRASYTYSSALFHPSHPIPALSWEQCPKNSSFVQPVSPATCGRNVPERFPLFI